jgi:TonB family protein
MKTFLIYLLFPSFFAYINLFAQSNDSDNLAENTGFANELQPGLNAETSFIKTNNIDLCDSRKVKLIQNIEMSITPENSSYKSGLKIPAGEIVDAFNYFPKEAVWAVKYKNTWGFIPVTAVKPVIAADSDATALICDEDPIMLTDIIVDYPTEALISGITGQVIVRTLVSKTGAVLETEIIKGIKGLDDAAIAAVNNVKFRPGTLNKKPVNAWTYVTVKFELSK